MKFYVIMEDHLLLFQAVYFGTPFQEYKLQSLIEVRGKLKWKATKDNLIPDEIIDIFEGRLRFYEDMINLWDFYFYQ